MSKNIPFSSKHTLVWDKQNGDSFMSDGELAFTSFDKNTTKFFRLFWMSNMMKKKEKPIIHPTQKPIQLYRWLLENYAEPTDKILDTHLGSGSIAIACHYFGIKEFVGIEIDKEYFDMASERIEKQTMQIKLL
jgi:site-specific DNA-methyltransferase (adenine-specific)